CCGNNSSFFSHPIKGNRKLKPSMIYLCFILLILKIKISSLYQTCRISLGVKRRMFVRLPNCLRHSRKFQDHHAFLYPSISTNFVPRNKSVHWKRLSFCLTNRSGYYTLNSLFSNASKNHSSTSSLTLGGMWCGWHSSTPGQTHFGQVFSNNPTIQLICCKNRTQSCQ